MKKKWKDWSALQKFWLWMGVWFGTFFGILVYQGDDSPTMFQALLWIAFCFGNWQADEIKQLKKKLDEESK